MAGPRSWRSGAGAPFAAGEWARRSRGWAVRWRRDRATPDLSQRRGSRRKAARAPRRVVGPRHNSPAGTAKAKLLGLSAGGRTRRPGDALSVRTPADALLGGRHVVAATRKLATCRHASRPVQRSACCRLRCSSARGGGEMRWDAPWGGARPCCPTNIDGSTTMLTGEHRRERARSALGVARCCATGRAGGGTPGRNGRVERGQATSQLQRGDRKKTVTASSRRGRPSNRSTPPEATPRIHPAREVRHAKNRCFRVPDCQTRSSKVEGHIRPGRPRWPGRVLDRRG